MKNEYEFEGTVSIDPVIHEKNNFKFATIVLEQTEEYENGPKVNAVPFEGAFALAGPIMEAQKGDKVSVIFKVKGSVWNEKYYTKNSIKKITIVSKADKQASEKPKAKAALEELPF